MQRPNQPSRSLLFPAAPNVDCYSAVGSVEAARSRLAEVIRGDEGVGLLIGPAGTGKSLLCCLLAESLKDDFHVVLLADSQLTSGETLLKHILFHLKMPYRGLSESELRLSLIDQLTQGMRGSAKSALALIIDEAQALSPSLLEEIRMMTNIVRDGQSRVRMVLAGGPELEDRLSEPMLESLNQRIASRCYLHPLALGETARYVHDAAMRSGLNPGVLIDDDAIRVVYQASGGIPRLVNQLMRQAIAISPAETIRPAQVNLAWQTLQQLPSPVTDAEANTLGLIERDDVLRETPLDAPTTPVRAEAEDSPAESSIVEFGILSADATESGSQGESERLAPQDEDAAPEPIDPIAAADPTVAADLQRVTESLQRLAEDSPDAFGEDAGDASVTPDTAGRPEAHEPPESATADAANLQFDCHAVDGEIDLPDNFREACRSEELIMEWNQQLPDVAPFDEVTACESPRKPVLSSEELFGADFDEEEAIKTERNYGTPLAPTLTINAEAVSGTELEEEVHEQIVGIIEATTDVPETLEFPSHSLRSGERSLPDDIQLSDDSDMLVIEETVDVEPVRIQTPLFDDDPSDSSDYQALLNRMRQG